MRPNFLGLSLRQLLVTQKEKRQRDRAGDREREREGEHAVTWAKTKEKHTHSIGLPVIRAMNELTYEAATFSKKRQRIISTTDNDSVVSLLDRTRAVLCALGSTGLSKVFFCIGTARVFEPVRYGGNPQRCFSDSSLAHPRFPLSQSKSSLTSGISVKSPFGNGSLGWLVHPLPPPPPLTICLEFIRNSFLQID